MTAPARNSPCSCGSGRRYKQCHGALAEPPGSRDAGNALLREALALQQARRLPEAASRYEQGLAQLPDSADGWHMLGVIDFEQGRHPLAVERIMRALDLTGWRIAAMRHNLGLAIAKLRSGEDERGIEALHDRYRRRCVGAGPVAETQPPPLVTVVMPACNHAAYVEAALRSVFAQSHRALEIVVVDDGSTDATPAVIERCLRDSPFPSRFLVQSNAGAANALNRGIDAAAGSFIQLLNSDDALAPQRVERMLAATAACAAPWGFSAVALIDARGRPADALADRRAFDLLCSTSGVPFNDTTGFALLSSNVAVSSGNLFLARDFVRDVGPFADFRYNHDWDFCLRALVLAEPAWVPDALYLYRLHGANTITESATHASDEAMRVCASYLDWATHVVEPANPFAPAIATWGARFVNAALGSGMGALLPTAAMRRVVLRALPATPATK